MTLNFSQIVDSVLADHTTSFWLRDALSHALKRDPVDALADAEALTQLLHRRLSTMSERPPSDTIAEEQALHDVLDKHQRQVSTRPATSVK